MYIYVLVYKVVSLYVIVYLIICQFGCYFDFEEDEFNEVERFLEYGIKEVFWQIICFWLEKKDFLELIVGMIIKVLKECDVNLKGQLYI